MTVYVDDFYKSPMGQFGRMKMSHMMADTKTELCDMADKIGVARRWIQYPLNINKCHFDVCKSKRELAIKHGAIAISSRGLAQKMCDVTK